MCAGGLGGSRRGTPLLRGVDASWLESTWAPGNVDRLCRCYGQVRGSCEKDCASSRGSQIGVPCILHWNYSVHQLGSRTVARELDGLSARLQSEIEALPPELQQFVLDGLAATRDSAPVTEAALPPPPTVDDRELARAVLYPRRDLHDDPLDDAEQAEFDALVATASGDLSQRSAVYNQQVVMLTLTEAAQRLQMSAKEVRRLIRSGRLHAFRMSRTVRVRSDLVWALLHRPDLDTGYLRKGPAYRPTCDVHDPFEGVPIDDVAATLRVRPHTLRCWARRQRASGGDLWTHAGRGGSAVVMSATLSLHRIPFDESRLRFVSRADTQRLSRAEKRQFEERMRLVTGTVAPKHVRRTYRLRDPESGQLLHTLAEAAEMMGLTVSGARKAIARAGIPAQILGGVARVRHDDLDYLLTSRERAARPNPRVLPRKVISERPLIPVAEAATRLGVTVRTLRRWIAAKKIVGVIRDSVLWVRSADLRAHGTATAERVQRRQQERASNQQIAARGATLTDSHMTTFVKWLYASDPTIDLKLAIHNRSSAAELAGCRPSTIEALVSEGLIPAQRQGRDLRIRTVDLVAAGVFSAKVTRMCPHLRLDSVKARRNVVSEFLSFEQTAAALERPVSEIRRLVSAGVLRGVKFGRVHRLHESEVTGPGLARFNEIAPPYPPLKYRRSFSDVTVNEAANDLGLSERSVLRWVRKGALLGAYATREKWKQSPTGAWVKTRVPVNRNGALISGRSVAAARRLRQARDLLPRDVIEVTDTELVSGTLPELQPWQEFVLVEQRVYAA